MIERLRSGDPTAWNEFVERYRRLIYSAIHRSNERFGAGWDEITMEEVFEDVLYKLLRENGRALAAWQGRCRLETWVYRIVRNACVDRLRKTSRRNAREVPTERDSDRGERPAPRTLEDGPRRDLRISLEQAIANSLETREAIAVRLIYFEGYTYREVAERLGTTIGAMSGLVYRALQKLKADGGLADGRGKE